MSANDDQPEERRLTARVHGHVQGVYYRDFCRRSAVRLARDAGEAVTGYARNLPDGTTVEVVAEGSRAALELLLEELRRGPPLAQIVRVEVSWGAPTREFDGFTLRW